MEFTDLFNYLVEMAWEIVSYLFITVFGAAWTLTVGILSDYVWLHMTLTLMFVLLISTYVALQKFDH